MESTNGSLGHQVNVKQNQVQTIDPAGPSILINGPRHRPLTLMRHCRGVLCLLALQQKVNLLPVRNVACTVAFLFEKINQTRFIFSGESVLPRERVLLFANHRTEVDWMYLWDFALRKGRLQCIKYILKKSLMKLPVFNWAFHLIEFIPVERKWEIDEPVIRSRLSELKNPKDPLWLAVFPEGTDYTEKKCIRSQEYAAEHGLPILKNVLLPKTKGFNCCLQELRGSIDAVYDITIAYKHRPPTFLDSVYGINPSEVHIHIESIQVSDIPTSEDEIADWLIGRFRLKDELLSNFSTLGHFPNEGTEGDLSTVKCLANFAAVVGVTGVLTYLTLFSSPWFKIFVAFSCTFLTFTTLYNIHFPQLIGSPEARVHAKKA